MNFSNKAINLLKKATVKKSSSSSTGTLTLTSSTSSTSATAPTRSVHTCDACKQAIDGDICTLLGGERTAAPRQLCRVCLNAAALFGALAGARLLEIGSTQFIITDHPGAKCHTCEAPDVVPAIKFIETNCQVAGDTVGTSYWLCAACMLRVAKLNSDAKVSAPVVEEPVKVVVDTARSGPADEQEEVVREMPPVDWSILNIDDDDSSENDEDSAEIPLAAPISAPPEPGDDEVENDTLLTCPTSEWMTILRKAGIEASMLRNPAVMHALMASFEETGIHVSRQEVDALSVAAASKPVPTPPVVERATPVASPPPAPPTPPPTPSPRITPSNRRALNAESDMLGAIRSKKLRTVQIATLDRAPHRDPGTLARALQEAILKRRPALVTTLRNAGTLIDWSDEGTQAIEVKSASKPVEPGVGTLKRKKLCERCSERKAAARVTLPNTQQMRVCAQCVVELQKETEGGLS
jgi:hypothetical protein